MRLLIDRLHEPVDVVATPILARDALNIEFGRLQLEQATWAQANRIDQLAQERLGMKFPEATDIVVVRP